MRKALLLCMLCLATSIVCAQEQQQQPPQLQVGDTITVNKDATHYLTGEKISNWVYRVSHRIRQIGSKQWKDGILIRGINSWLAPTSVTKVGEQRPVVAEQPKEEAPAVAEQPKAEAPVVAEQPKEELPVQKVYVQTSLKGRVIANNTNEPIIGAKVTLANQNISTTTNVDGEFILSYLEPTDEEVIVEADGYIAALELVNLQENQINEMEDVLMGPDVVALAHDEILLNLTEEEMTDDEGRSQAQASSSSASTDVFNSTTSFAWSTARYRNRGYQSNV